MHVRGIDFTSSPSKRKPITCIHAELLGNDLLVRSLERWDDFTLLESALAQPGPWIAGIDFPFGQANKFIRNIGWPSNWRHYVEHVTRLSRAEFRKALDDYRNARPAGDKEHRRATDIAAGSISPQKLHGVPVALMFYEGSPRLLSSGVTIPGVIEVDPDRIVIEAYPGVLARRLIGRRGYKNDSRKKQTTDHYEARVGMLDSLRSGNVLRSHGIQVHADGALADDPGGDDLDALLCAVQAASYWVGPYGPRGAPSNCDPNEGWIAEPTIY
jgi:hypothetical protein